MTDKSFDEFYGYRFEDLKVGMSAAYGRTVSQADILMFAGVSGDTNPVHLNEELASASMFEGCIAHGMLAASFISTVFGTKLPGTPSAWSVLHQEPQRGEAQGGVRYRMHGR